MHVDGCVPLDTKCSATVPVSVGSKAARPMARRPQPSLSHPRTLSAAILEESVTAATALVDKWHPDASPSSLFLDRSDGPAEEAAHFLRAAADLHRSMHLLASDAAGLVDCGDGLVQAQELLQTAMRRLRLELQLLLSSLDANATGAFADHEVQGTGVVGTTSHIRTVAEAMMAAGYGKECVSTFKSHRRAAVAGAVQRLLGFSPSQHAIFQKLSWGQVDGKVQSWFATARFAFKSVFSGERGLCASVFANHAAVGDAVFAGIVSDQAADLIAVAEAAVSRARRAPERLFRVLDVHGTITDILPAIVSIFGNRSEIATRTAAALGKVGEAARGTLASFEAAIQKEKSKATVPGGAVHPLTRYVMNYLVVLANYEDDLAGIYRQGQGVRVQSVDTSSTSTGSASSDSSSPSLSLSSNPIAWLVFVLLHELDAKAESYREAALSSLFLANNTMYVVKKVRGSSKLEGILGEGWTEAHRAKARQHVDACVHAAWSKVVVGGAEGVEAAVMEAVAMQGRWVVADDEMAEAVRAAAAAAVVPAYRVFYRRHGAAEGLTPGDVKAMIGRLFGGRPAGGGAPRRLHRTVHATASASAAARGSNQIIQGAPPCINSS